jgi:hypothetical protein
VPDRYTSADFNRRPKPKPNPFLVPHPLGRPQAQKKKNDGVSLGGLVRRLANRVPPAPVPGWAKSAAEFTGIPEGARIGKAYAQHPLRQLGYRLQGKDLKGRQFATLGGSPSLGGALPLGRMPRLLSIEQARRLTPEETLGWAFHGSSKGKEIMRSGHIKPTGPQGYQPLAWSTVDPDYATHYAAWNSPLGSVVAFPHDWLPANKKVFGPSAHRDPTGVGVTYSTPESIVLRGPQRAEAIAKARLVNRLQKKRNKGYR